MHTFHKSEVEKPESREGSVNQPRPVAYRPPVVNIHQDGNGYTLEVEMPGVTKSGVEISVADGKLKLIGHRADGQQEGMLLYRESQEIHYHRVFDLDPEIDVANISAAMEQGLLTVRLPKAEAAKPRKIKVE